MGLTDTYEGRGLAALDFDNNGTFDIAIANMNAPAVLYKNTVENAHWIGFKLVGRSPNTDAIGSRVILSTNKGKQYREIFPGNGFASQSDPRALFGLGSSQVREVEIVWPDGSYDKLPSFVANAYNTVVQR